MDAFFLDEILHAFNAVITGGYLTIHPWVLMMLATMITMMLLLGVAAVSLVPTIGSLGAIGALTLRAGAIVAIANNWNYVFDTFQKSVIQLGLLIGQSTITVEEFMSPGRVLYLGLILAENMMNVTVAMGLSDTWNPIIIVGYIIAYYAILLAFFAIALYVMTSLMEFLLVSVYAFMVWPTMSVTFLSWIAWPLLQAVIGVSLRLSGLAVMMSIILPFVTTLAIPAGDITFQSSVVFGLGCLGMAIFCWRGPTWVGASSMPGMSLRNLALLSMVAFRRF